MTNQNHDRNLFFGILGLQVGFISQSQLIESMQQWILEKESCIEEIFVRKGFMTQQYADFLEQLVDKHVQLHEGAMEKSFASLSSIHDVRKKLEALDDSDLDATLTKAAGPKSSGFDETKIEATGRGAISPPKIKPGERFRILRPHARGGLGEVSVAEDSELNREVAFKQIRDPYSEDTVSRTRFLVEAEVTGRLEHPGIVPVYSLGQDKEGRPFYVMRFIKGNSLKDALRDFHSRPAASDIETRLQLHGLVSRLVDVCMAVEYAHSRGVLHRDLKPGNIMLGKYGETLVVDWGLAKTVARNEQANSDEATVVPLSGDGSTETMMGTVVGTIAYMSPEQAAGDLSLLGPRSDVYCLGSTLYAILSGETPVKKGSQVEMLEAIGKGNIKPLKQVAPSVDPALAAICTKAMSTRQQDRYESAKTLAADLELWLADEPVGAFPEPVAKKLWRLARRHRTFVGSTFSVLVLSLVGLGIFNTILAAKNDELQTANQQILKQSEQLKQEQEQLEASRESLGQLAYNVLESAEIGLRDMPGIESFRTQMLSRAHESLTSAVEFNPESATLRRSLADSARIISQQATRIGDEEQGLEMMTLAISLLERLNEEASDATQDGERLIDLIETYSTHVGTLRRNNQFPEAAQSSARAVELLATLSSSEEVPEYRMLRVTGRCLLTRAGVLRDLLEWSEMESQITRSVDAMDQLRLLVAQDRKRASVNDEAFHFIAIGLKGEALLNVNKFDESAATYEAGITGIETIIAEKGTSITKQYLLAILLNGSGELANETGKIDAVTLGTQQRAVNLMNKLHEKSETVGFQERLGNYQTTLAEMQFRMDQVKPAEESIRKAVEELTDLQQKGPAADFRRSLAKSLQTRADIKLHVGDADGASNDLRQAIQLLDDAVAATSSCLAFVELQSRIQSQLESIEQQ